MKIGAHGSSERTENEGARTLSTVHLTVGAVRHDLVIIRDNNLDFDQDLDELDDCLLRKQAPYHPEAPECADMMYTPIQ